MSWSIYENSALIERGDDATRTVTTYAVGDLATYAGTAYRCVQAHTAIAGWTPAAVPALWTPAKEPDRP